MEQRRQTISILFADVVGYSSINDDTLYATLKEHNEAFSRRHLSPDNHFLYNTWGDAFFICSYDPLDLAEVALSLRDYYRNTNWRRMGFQQPVSIRVGLHMETVTVLLEQGIPKDIVGRNVNEAARIEPVVEADQVYCSDVFFTHLSRDPDSNCKGEHLGKVELAKQFGQMELYRLTRDYETYTQPVEPTVQTSSPEPSGDPLVAVLAEGKLRLIHAKSVQLSDILKMDLLPEDPEETAFLTGLKDNWNSEPVAVAYGTSAILGSVQAASQTVKSGQEVWSIELKPKGDQGAGFEVSFSGLSADEIAELRARRVLLNENLDLRGRFGTLDGQMVESAIRNQDSLGGRTGSPIVITESPLPKLYADLRSDKAQFLEAARLVATLWLKISGTVEHILHLNLDFTGEDVLQVDFRGRRKRVYSNADPYEIAVEGECTLV